MAEQKLPTSADIDLLCIFERTVNDTDFDFTTFLSELESVLNHVEKNLGIDLPVRVNLIRDCVFHLKRHFQVF